MKRNIQIKRISSLISLWLLLCACVVNAQNVTVRPSTGAMIAAVPENIQGAGSEYDVFYKRGGFATWRHNQLCLTMTTSDAPGLTANGQLANPANNLFGRTATNEIEMGRGATNVTRNCYMNLALPKGYRFTGYEIVFSRNRDDFGNNDNGWYNSTNNPNTEGTMRFGETDKDFNYLDEYYQDITYNANATIDNGSVTISKEDETGMSNVLYFRLTDANTGTGRMVVTFHSITLYFTAENDYTPLLPLSAIDSPVSAIDIPFATGKVDYGSIEKRRYQGIERVSYSSASVIDMEAYMTLYEAESIKDGTNFDGTSGKVVDYKEGTISNIDDFFKLGREDAEQVYFIETPTYVTLPDENQTKNPVGYRIVEAELEYQFGTPSAASQITKTHNYITYKQGNTTYYLNTEGKFVTDTKTEWFTDDQNRIYSGNVYLGYTVSGYYDYEYNFMTFTSVPGYPLYAYNGNVLGVFRDDWWDTYTPYLIGSTSTATLSTSNSNKRASWTTETTTTTIPAYTPAPFKLHVYDKDGTLKETREVNSSADNGRVTLLGLNNDAVKFGIEGIGLVKGHLTMQALDPYIDRMSVVCQDQDRPQIRMTETFIASDFSVSGGEFYFYLPEDCKDHRVKVTYEDLWSHYADESYEGGSSEHNSRFSFVNSEHYKKYTNDNIYNDVEEAAAGKGKVSERQIVETVGRTKFKFNNADELSSSNGLLTEYPFTLANYAAAPNNGSFYNMDYTVSTDDQTQTAYVFTTDETRYNIAPTTAVQHRTYAFYEMIVHVQSATYAPKVKIQKLYNTTCVEENRKPIDKPYYGAIVTANYGSQSNAGFSSDMEVEKAIDKVISNGIDDFGNTDVPQSAKQILYVDLSSLTGYYTNTQADMTLNEYKNAKLATNALVFMPKGVTTTDDNFAYMTPGENFRAANNIILTDKQPFFSPYDIQVPSQNYATYKRLASATGDKLVKYATIIMPFNLKVQGGHHVNDTFDGFEFDIRQMTSLKINDDVSDHYGDAVFNLISGSEALANTPYMVEVTSASGADFSFIAAQKGSAIKATPVSDDPTKIEGETVSVDGGTFTNFGTYAGVAIPKAENAYYFNKDKYVSSTSLSSAYTHAYIQPFRAYYATSGVSGAKTMSYFNILYDVLDEDNTETSIRGPRGNCSLSINAGQGTMLLTAREGTAVSVKNVSGTQVAQFNMIHGEQRLLSLPAGIYIVNNAKIIVK